MRRRRSSSCFAASQTVVGSEEWLNHKKLHSEKTICCYRQSNRHFLAKLALQSILKGQLPSSVCVSNKGIIQDKQHLAVLGRGNMKQQKLSEFTGLKIKIASADSFCLSKPPPRGQPTYRNLPATNQGVTSSAL